MATVNDDAASPANSGQNQSSGVIPETNIPTNVSSSGSGQGTSASPGPSGTGGNNPLPGRRTYNPLSKLASYNYILSLYQLSPDAYEAFLQTGRKKIDILTTSAMSPASERGAGAFLIAQSGGINSQTQTRAPGFELDLYIESFSYTVATSSNETGVPAFIQDAKMTIVEPYGFSFLSNLKRCLTALQSYSKTTGFKENINALKQFFVIGIKFYGYDINGNIVKGSDVIDGSPLDPGNDSTNLFESYYDLELLTFTFQLNGTSTTYNITFSTPGTMTNLGTKRGRILTGARVTGSTVKEMLTGPEGLFTVLQQEQKTQADGKLRQIPNNYEIEFQGEALQRIQNAKTVTQDDLDKIRWPGSGAKNVLSVNDNTALKAVANNTSRQLTFNADTSIIQAISLIIQKSEFMVNALKTVYNNTVEPDIKQKNLIQNPNPAPQQLSWFNVSVELKDIKWDSQIMDWAYTTKYIVTLYEVPSINVPFSSNVSKYYGPHKYYNYYLTGLNTEVLDFVLTFNLAYQNTMFGSVPNSQQITPPLGTSTGQTSILPGARGESETTSSINSGMQAQSSVVTALTSPEAYVQAKISILGDPDFLVRDQVTSISSLYEKFYDTTQFTISAHGGMVYVELILKEATDYKNSVGILEVNDSIQFFPYPKSVRDVAKGIIYQVQTVTANFMNGKFLMTLDVRGAQSWPPDDTPTEDQPEGASGREAQAVTASGSGSSSGPSSGAGNGTTATTGTLQDSPKPKPEVASPGVQQGSTNTVGNPAPIAVNTATGLVADDDAQPSSATSPVTDQDTSRYDFDGTTWYDSNGEALAEPPE